MFCLRFGIAKRTQWPGSLRGRSFGRPLAGDCVGDELGQTDAGGAGAVDQQPPGDRDPAPRGGQPGVGIQGPRDLGTGHDAA